MLPATARPREDGCKESSSKQEGIMGRMALNDNKAGMSGLDKEKINKVIMENTIGSRYYKNEQKRDAQVKERIEKMQSRLKMFTRQEKEAALCKADVIAGNIEKNRDLLRTIVHIDMDAFYASVEERDKPELKEKPMAVGGMDMLSTSNYIARKFGVRAAMPGFIAMKLCPHLVIVPLNFDKYKQVSKEVQEIYGEYDCNFMAASLDEAYLDITDHLKSRVILSEEERTFRYNPDLLETSRNQDNAADKSQPKSKTFGFSPEDVAEEIRFRIHQKTKLTASAGIAPNLMLAKIGSDFNKPNGQTYIPPSKEYILKFVKNLPIRKVSGIGKVSEQLLAALDIKKCGDLYTNRATLVLLFSEVSSSFFLRTGLGSSSNTVDNDSERKSISTERTFNAISKPKDLLAKLRELCESLSEDAVKRCVQGKTVTLKTKTINFELHTRCKSSGWPLSYSDEIFAVAKDLLNNEIAQSNNTLSLRLMGVGLSKLEPLSGTNQYRIKKFFSKINPTATIQPKSPENSPSMLEEQAFQEADMSNDENPETHESAANSVENNAGIPCTSATVNKDAQAVSSASLKQDLACPVCLKKDFRDLATLNQHLDACVTSSPPTKKVVSNISKSAKGGEFCCPICGMAFDSTRTSLQYLNTHVDDCLNRRAIKDILRNESPTKKAIKREKQSKQAKRRKLNPVQNNTLDKFFS